MFRDQVVAHDRSLFSEILHLLVGNPPKFLVVTREVTGRVKVEPSEAQSLCSRDCLLNKRRTDTLAAILRRNKEMSEPRTQRRPNSHVRRDETYRTNNCVVF